MERVIYLLKPTSYMVPTQTLPLLGRIVPNFAAPANDYKPHKRAVFDKGDVNQSALKACALTAAKSNDRGHDAEVEGACGYKRDESTKNSITLETNKLLFVSIEQHGELLKTMMKDEDIRLQVNSWTRHAIWTGPPVCMIVGVLLCDEGAVSIVKEKSQKLTVEGILPLATIAAAVAAVPLAIPWGNIRAGIELGSSQTMDLDCKFDDMQIVGLEYRILRRATWRNDVKLRRTGVLRHEGPHLAGPDAEDGTFEEFDEQLKDDKLELAELCN